MTHPNKVKGDRAELEVARLIHDLTGWPARRKLGAGRTDDEGDIEGVPNTCIQVANWLDVLRAVRQKPIEAEQQRINAGVPFVATMIRLRGGDWRVVLTLDQWAIYARESIQPTENK